MKAPTWTKSSDVSTEYGIGTMLAIYASEDRTEPAYRELDGTKWDLRRRSE